MLGAARVEEVAAATGLDDRSVRRAVDRLVRGGLVERVAEGGLVARSERFEQAVRATAMPAADPAPAGTPPEVASVLRAFVRDGRLVSVPAQHAKRLVILDPVAQSFEPGAVYPERDVNFALLKWHADYAALRRYLVDDGFLERRDGFYWRAGGSFVPD